MKNKTSAPISNDEENGIKGGRAIKNPAKQAIENFRNSIDGGVMVVSIGQDLVGEQNLFGSRLTWKKLKNAIESYYGGKKKVRKIPTVIDEKSSIDDFVAPYRSYNGIYEPNEYYVAVEGNGNDGRLADIKPFSDIIYRIMNRKYMQLTDKGRRGYITILLDTFSAYIYLRLKEGENGKAVQIIKLQEKWRKLNLHNNSKEECELIDQKWIKFPFKISMFLHVDVGLLGPVAEIPEAEPVERVGNLSVLVEPLNDGNDFPKCPIEFLSRKPSFLYVRILEGQGNSNDQGKSKNEYITWENPVGSPNCLKTDKPWENLKIDIRYLNIKTTKGKGEKYIFISLYDFMVLNGWFRVVRKTREIVNLIKPSEALDIKRYLTALHEMRRYLSMSASIITIKDKQVSASYYFDDVKKIPEKIRTTLEDLLDITSSDGRRSKYKIIEYERIFRKSVKCSVEGDYVYGNRIVSFVPAEKSEKEYYKKNMVYLNESGIRRYISWLIIIGDFITTLAENFEIHNREFLKLEGKEVGHNIGKLLRKAKELAREYDHYFNVRNITDLEMRDLYEIMRENVGINEDRNFIDKRLEMLQSSDIVANNRKLQISIIFFTLVTVLEVFFRDINYPLLNQVAVYSIISLIFFIYILDYHRLGFIFKYIFRIIRGR